MSGHTRGPWEVLTELELRDTDEIICDMMNGAYVAITKGQKLAPWRDDANFIAAAPRMLEALENFKRVLGSRVRNGKHSDEYADAFYQAEKMMDEAICLAKGEKP